MREQEGDEREMNRCFADKRNEEPGASDFAFSPYVSCAVNMTSVSASTCFFPAFSSHFP